MPEVNATAIFCEDARTEANGQEMLIGIYGDNIEVSGFPGMMPKLCIYIRINLSMDFQADAFNLFLTSPDGGRVLINTIAQDVIAEAIRSARAGGNEIAGLYSKIVAAPFSVPTAGRFKLELESSAFTKLIGTINFAQLKSSSVAAVGNAD